MLELTQSMKEIKKQTNLPIVSGFGIKNEKQVQDVCQISEGAVVGSSIVKIIENNLDNTDDVKEPNKTNIDTEQLNIMDTNNDEEDLDVPTYLRNKRD